MHGLWYNHSHVERETPPKNRRTQSVRLPESVGLVEQGMLLSLHSATQSPSWPFRKVAVKGPKYAITPADTRTSPVRFMYLTPNRSADSSHRAFSPPSPSISCLGLSVGCAGVQGGAWLKRVRRATRLESGRETHRSKISTIYSCGVPS